MGARAAEPSASAIRFHVEGGHAVDVATLPKRELRPLRRQMQMIFQDPFSSLNPRMTLIDIIGEPLLVNGMRDLEARRDRVRELATVAPGRLVCCHRAQELSLTGVTS